MHTTLGSNQTDWSAQPVCHSGSEQSITNLSILLATWRIVMYM